MSPTSSNGNESTVFTLLCLESVSLISSSDGRVGQDGQNCLKPPTVLSLLQLGSRGERSSVTPLQENRHLQAPCGATRHSCSRSGIRACVFLFSKIRITKSRALFQNELKWHRIEEHYSKHGYSVNIRVVVAGKGCQSQGG